LYSGTAPSSHSPSGSAPSAPSSYGSITVAGIPLNYNGNPNFNNYIYVDPEAILNEKYPKPPEPNIPSPSGLNIDDEACFVAGTLVLMADFSMKKIENIIVGDHVLARNDQFPNHRSESRRINEIKHNPPSVTYHLRFHANSRDEEIYIRVTLEHPFYVEHRGWIAVENLNIGDVCVTPNENKFQLVSKEFDPTLIPVYNLEVDQDHTYFVGEDTNNCILVHNQYDPPKLQNADTIFDRKVFKNIDGSSRLEEMSTWATRIFNEYIARQQEIRQLSGLDYGEALYGLLVESAANALIHGVDEKTLNLAIQKSNRLAQYNAAYWDIRGTVALANIIIDEAKKIIKDQVKNELVAGKLKGLDRIDIVKTSIGTIFEAMGDIQRAEFIRRVITDPTTSGQVIHTGPQKGPTLPQQVPKHNQPPRPHSGVWR
jgi:hypothetical protein